MRSGDVPLTSASSDRSHHSIQSTVSRRAAVRYARPTSAEIEDEAAGVSSQGWAGGQYDRLPALMADLRRAYQLTGCRMNRKERRAAAKRRDRALRSGTEGTHSVPDGSAADLMAEANRQYKQGRLVQAQSLCHRLLASDPANFNGLNLLGVIAQASGDHRLAVKMFAKAIAADRLNAACHYNIANSYQALDRRAEAVSHFKTAIALGMSDKSIEGMILQSPLIAGVVDRIWSKWPMPIGSEELFGASGIAAIASDAFLLCAMETTIIKSLSIENVLVRVRLELLRLAAADAAVSGDAGTIIGLFSALAQQCFIGEYIFDQTEEETRLAARLRDSLVQKLKDGDDMSALLLTAVAAYFPLHTLPSADALLHRDFAEEVAGLLRLQVREPQEEARDRAAIPALTTIEDGVSLEVMRQYEESPYPRWTTDRHAPFVADRAQEETGDCAEDRAKLEILVAGCGTGRHAIGVAALFPNSRVLAIDISRVSLAYARRRTRELGLHNVEYAQADILKLATIGRTFDRIDAVGVLHHLAEPTSGWRVLLSLLRPDGEMRIGLYSELARQSIVQARALSAQRGYRATSDDIRKLRQEIVRDADNLRWKLIKSFPDFYSMSGCRDLLFNVMEHRFSIPEIALFLNDNDLSFLGFEFRRDSLIVEQFRERFPDPSALTNLDNWHAFELSNPQTFSGMYVFWCARASAPPPTG
jgi:SAM-dependent methyltransferase/Flp pilus assembly protein TadD